MSIARLIQSRQVFNTIFLNRKRSEKPFFSETLRLKDYLRRSASSKITRGFSPAMCTFTSLMSLLGWVSGWKGFNGNLDPQSNPVS